ncbi:hypothetical protein GCM10009133_08140 [Cocleimonas flava]|uniref:Uncharacterized protein n=1 Tax=Cocleimonas flava TaxID=634765 RepID=A0A4R1F5T8_9GAMM|nr:hypothetical protein [Cocleimonas flava]TCJ87178.1 hypothetical protein EV695_1681 [Cocleimonas flava]
MKRLISLLPLLLLLTVFSAEANYYANNEINTYDPVSGYYYKAIVSVGEGKGILSSNKSSGKMTNLAIYDPRSETHKLLFDKSSDRMISFVYFESAYQGNSIQFNGAEVAYNPVIKNNASVPERQPKDKLLIGLKDNEKRVTDLWVSKKDGSELQKVVSVGVGSSWHIDVKNAVIRVVTINNQDLKIQNFSW